MRSLTQKRSRVKEIVYKSANVQGILSSEQFIVRFEGSPLDTVIDALLKKDRVTPDRNLLVFDRETVVSNSWVTPQLKVIY